jgi:uncharacterized DUF497 family protein
MGAGRIFEWDESKRRSNLRKHGLDFADCAAVFNGVTVTSADDRYGYGEVRFVTLGLLNWRVVCVVHTEADEVLRIISFRRANTCEQAEYFQTFQN